MDMDLVHILDCNIVTLKPASRRRLQSTVPACVKKYLENVQKCWKSQNIENRAKSILQETIEHGMSAQLEQKLNNLDSNISEIMRHAEKKCSKLHSTIQNDWSVKFHHKLQNMYHKRNQKN